MAKRQKYRVGPKMVDAYEIVRMRPGCNKSYVASRVGPNGSLQYGYRTVDRAIEAGLIKAEPNRTHTRYKLYVRD